MRSEGLTLGADSLIHGQPSALQEISGDLRFLHVAQNDDSHSTLHECRTLPAIICSNYIAVSNKAIKKPSTGSFIHCMLHYASIAMVTRKTDLLRRTSPARHLSTSGRKEHPYWSRNT